MRTAAICSVRLGGWALPHIARTMDRGDVRESRAESGAVEDAEYNEGEMLPHASRGQRSADVGRGQWGAIEGSWEGAHVAQGVGGGDDGLRGSICEGVRGSGVREVHENAEGAQRRSKGSGIRELRVRSRVIGTGDGDGWGPVAMTRAVGREELAYAAVRERKWLSD
ncbi:hypothetical protein BV25DRAFT_1843077 [Artomyces pyxidatus]|uniref:Uncharacterized protein n=1 Tax=Artomyces pyxidatus TaxID=48021 RepID=A0ACB8SGA5_9AGAM|nr:hypothetical protein BV25DRAFT_1843077 [Artomyces pyxidatus]